MILEAVTTGLWVFALLSFGVCGIVWFYQYVRRRDQEDQVRKLKRAISSEGENYS